MKMQTITREGHEFVLVPMKAYEQLLEDAEMLADIRDYREGRAVAGWKRRHLC